MLDNILRGVRRGAGRVQRRGEEVAQVARLRLEIFSLTRELDALYARLGRSYHSGADVAVLQGVRDDIKRVDEEISAREHLIRELSEGQGREGGAEDADPAILPAASLPEHAGSGVEPTVPDAVPRPHEGAEPGHAASGQTVIVSAVPGAVRRDEDDPLDPSRR